MHTRLVAVVLVLAGLLVSAATAAEPDTKNMVLKLGDLPAGFSLDKGYYSNNVQAAKESANQTLADYTRWGRINGYEADFSRQAITGIIEIDSAASTYKTVKGAADSTHDSYAVEGKKQDFNGQKVAFKRVSTGAAKIGHEARMFTVTVKNQGISVAVYVVLWRYRVVKASVFIAGIAGTVDAAVAVKLALKQQARIAAAVQ